MRIGGAKKVHYDSGPNMTPLVDVVMCILIFLMMVGSFEGLQHYLVSNIPFTPKGAGGVDNKDAVPDEPVTITVDADPRYPDRYIARAGRIQATEGRVLAEALTQLRAQMNGAGTTTEKIQVVISPGRDVKYKSLLEVYESALEAQFTKISFATSH